MLKQKHHPTVSTWGRLVCLIPCCLLFALLTRGNEPPVISNLVVDVDPARSVVTVSYDVADAEGDPLQIACSLSDDDAQSFLYPIDGIRGDIGYPITPGAGKMVEWRFDPGVVDLTPASQRRFRLRLMADDLQPVSVPNALNKVSVPDLLADLEFIDGPRYLPINAAHHGKVGNLILDRFSKFGLRSRKAPFASGTNVIGRLPGHTQEATTYIVGAHYDTVSGTPGADDNGSGLVGMLEAARILSQMSFQRSIVFIAFDQEEMGLVGSSAYVRNQKPPFERIDGVLDLEMIGVFNPGTDSQRLPAGFDKLFPAFYNAVLAEGAKGDFIASMANTRSEPLRKAFDLAAATHVPSLRCLSLAVAGNGAIAPDLRRSDHAPFWDAGYQALMLTDTANFRSESYHTASDTIPSLDLEFLANVVRATIATVMELSGPVHAGVAVTERIVSQPEVRLKVSLQAAGTFRLEWSQSGVGMILQRRFSVQNGQWEDVLGRGMTNSIVLSFGAGPEFFRLVKP